MEQDVNNLNTHLRQLDDDEKINLINKGIKIGQEHSEPSHKTLKFMDDISKQIENNCLNIELMKKDINYLKEKFENNAKDHDEIKMMISDFIKSADGKYASRNFQNIVSKILWGVAAFVACAIGVAVFNVILK